MIERHIAFAVDPERSAEFERFCVEDYRPPVTRAPGFVAWSLLRVADEPGHYQMVFRWDTPDAAVAWRTSDVHQGLQPTLSALVSSMDIVVYAVVA